jgi:SAM-dependent methyltransferase
VSDDVGAVSMSRFEDAYRGTPPWDIGRPQPVIEDLAAAGEIPGPVLDAGCGTGENALYLAGRGLEVVGVDVVPAAVEAAREKARARGLTAEFLVLDARRLGELGRTFATVIDSGLFHVFAGDERERYAAALAAVLEPGGRCYVHAISELEKGPGGPPPVTRAELREAFDRPPFRVLSIEAAVIASTGDQTRHAWLARVERVTARGGLA